MKVVIVGCGYVGLVTGVCLAKLGHKIICVDVNSQIVNLINSGISPIHEKGLQEILRKVISSKNLKATCNLGEAMENADISIIAVGTPSKNGSIDLSNLKTTIKDLSEHLHLAASFHVVCIKSTVVPGTTEKIMNDILKKNSYSKRYKNVGFAMNPEFLAEGSAVNDFLYPDRIIIGASDKITIKKMKYLYDVFKGIDIIYTSLNTAEMIKYCSNAFFASIISFSNEIANLCYKLDGVDAVEVLNALHLDKRLSPFISNKRIKPDFLSFLHPGTGFGGSCFPKDLEALISFSKDLGKDMPLLSATLDTNIQQPNLTVDMARKELGNLKNKNIAVLGLAFKPQTADIRKSPAKIIIEKLIKEEANVIAHDPFAIPNMKKVLHDKRIKYSVDLKKVLKNIDIIILVTSWPIYKNIHKIRNVSKTPIIDGRRYLNKSNFDIYRGIGLNET